MFYKKFPPSKELQGIINCYYVWEGSSTQTIDIESPPSAYSSIVFNYSRPYSVSTNKYENKPAPESFICGQAIRNYTLHLSGTIGMVGIVFQPTGLYQLLGIPMYEFTGERLPLLDFFTTTHMELVDKINIDDSHHRKITKLETFVTQVLEDQEPLGTPQIQYAAKEIVDSYGNYKLSDLLKDIFMSRRQFERKFLEEVGVSPKAYAKIRRFGYTCSLMARNKDVKLSDVFYETGYYDQSHFIRDFKYFSGRTPKFYQNHNQELANYVRSLFSSSK